MVYFVIAFIFLLQYNIPPFYISSFPVIPDLLFSFILFYSFKCSRSKILVVVFLLSLIQDFQINFDIIGSVTFSNLIAIYIFSTILLLKNSTVRKFILYLTIFIILTFKYLIFYSILSFGKDISIFMIANAIVIQSFLTISIIAIVNEMILPNKILK